MMDHDQEVVREPFDDGESVVSLEQSGDDGSHRGTSEFVRRNSLNRNSTDYEQHSINPVASNFLASSNCNDNEDDDDNEMSDSSQEEEEDTDLATQEKDVKFAKKFGIELKTKPIKGESAYEKLLESGQLDATQIKPPQSHIGPKPLLKTSITSDCIYHKGTFYQKGDIVALRDQDDGQVYFAQLTGFLQDQYCEKSASVTWLVPIRATSREFFDPAAYKIGLEDPQLRKLDCVTFVRHCPHDYYLRKLFQAGTSTSSEQNTTNGLSLLKTRSSKEKSYIWTTMEPCLVPPLVSK